MRKSKVSSMGQTKVIMPQMGESVAEGTVAKWLKQPGDRVEKDENILEINTDKIDVEVPAPASGYLIQILIEEGATVEVGTVLAVIADSADEAATVAAAAAPKKVEKAKAVEPAAPAREPEPEPGKAKPAVSDPSDKRKFYTPVVLRMAAEQGIDLERVAGTGMGGRVTKKDLLNYIEEMKSAPAPPAAAASAPKPAMKLDVVHALVAEMTRIVVEAEGGVVSEGLESAFGAHYIEGDFRGVHLEGELDPLGLEHIQDGRPPVGQVLEPGVDHLGRRGRERVEQVPDGAAREAVHHVHAEALRRPGGLLHRLGRAPPHPFRVPVAPNALGEDAFVPRVDAVADGLAHEVARDGEDLKVVLLQGLPLGRAVGLVRFVHLEVIAPAGQLEAVVSEFLGLLAEGLEGQVRPLSGEEGHGSSHGRVSLLIHGISVRVIRCHRD